MNTPNHRRPGFTLIELLVVIAIITTLATLTALYFPFYQEREGVSRGVDQLSGLLLMARQQARRDGKPTGLRLFLEMDTSSPKPLNQGQSFCRRVAFIQQPDDLSFGHYAGKWKQEVATSPPDPPNPLAPRPARAWFELQGKEFQDPNVTSSPQLPVSKGDYLQIEAGGRIWKISKILDKNSLELEDGQRELPGSQLNESKPKTSFDSDANLNYQIIRQPIPVAGEQEVKLPESVGIDFGTHPASGFATKDKFGNKGMSRNIKGNATAIDVLFSPSGALIGSGTGSGQVILWVRDLTRDNKSGDIHAGYGVLVTAQPRTGFIASHPVASPSNPYAFTEDGKSSGM